MLFGSVVKRSVAERNEAANTFRDGFAPKVVGNQVNKVFPTGTEQVSTTEKVKCRMLTGFK